MKKKPILIIAGCILAVISGFAQKNNSFSNSGLLQYRPWLLKGNMGTDTAINFIGTTDAEPLVFKVNNQKAGYIDYSANANTGFGYQALYSNTEGAANTAVGYSTLMSNTFGTYNTATGYAALSSNTYGSSNTANGPYALFANTTGQSNTANGFQSLFLNQTGVNNTANGSISLVANTTGGDNTASGWQSLSNNSTGSYNTADGATALLSNITGKYNTGLGYGADVLNSDIKNATAIGSTAKVDASNAVRIGNTYVKSIGGQVSWTSFSDERIKDNVQENIPGLVFIRQLRPLTYHFNVGKEIALMGRTDSDYWDSKYNIEKIQFTGFLAQDVDRAAKNIGYDFSGIDKTGTIMGLRYSEFVVPLVKAVQELAVKDDDKDKQIEDLKKEVDNLKKIVLTLQSQMQNSSTSERKSSQIIEARGAAKLEQNTPNPFSNNTIIRYYIPANINSAQITIADVSGHQLKTISLGKGVSQTTFTAGELAAGNYTYTLIVDGRKVDARQMILTK